MKILILCALVVVVFSIRMEAENRIQNEEWEVPSKIENEVGKNKFNQK
jgi:hypothetical protein